MVEFRKLSDVMQESYKIYPKSSIFATRHDIRELYMVKYLIISEFIPLKNETGE
jgi:hypothetical protein